MFRGLFVTGTDTDIGKTTVAAAVMHRYRELRTLKYWKPVQTGIEQSDDTETVRRIGSCAGDELFSSGVRLPRPLSPHLSAALAGTRIQITDILKCIEGQPDSVRWVVEGAGGVLVPLNETEFMIDLIVHLNLPVLVATRASLGTINHTLLTIEALRARRLEVAGVVMVGDRNPENRRAIEEFGSVDVIGEMPRFPALTAESLGRWATLEFDKNGRLGSCFK